MASVNPSQRLRPMMAKINKREIEAKERKKEVSICFLRVPYNEASPLLTSDSGKVIHHFNRKSAPWGASHFLT